MISKPSRYCKLFFLIFSLLLGLGIFVAIAEKKENKNQLGKEKSPYLLQHKDNPVWWYAWGEDAFQVAKTQHKPIFLSIGYSTCHWCHVMEHESFEDQEVADLLNQYFISIKVDREERPDVDKIYMDAVVSMQGQGGWPLSVFLTPDLKPFFGATYFPKLQFMRILEQLHKSWTTEKDKILHAGESLTQHLNRSMVQDKGLDKMSERALALAFNHRKATFDEIHGGFGGAPKFPPSVGLMLLLRISRRTGSEKAREMVQVTLDQMAKGGIYDHLGGGFSRYSTDATWLVPHFEKMLYDNALLSMAYLEAYQFTKEDRYQKVARETLDYVLRVMKSPEGGFYSAEDADSEGKEGKFYVWRQEEIKEILTKEEFETFSKVYGVTESGNFEDETNILNLQKKIEWEIKNDSLIQSARKKLFQVREKRIHPHKDDKILTSWNGLMIASMAKGYQVLGDRRYLDAGQAAAKFIQTHLLKDQKLFRRYRDRETHFDATLDDHAFYIYGLLMLYEADFDPRWIEVAKEIQKIQDQYLWDEKGGYFFTSQNVKHLIRRSKDYEDGAIPNGNAMSVLNLLKLYHYTLDKSYVEKAKKTLLSTAQALTHYPGAFAQMQIALDTYLDRTKEIAIVGDKNDEHVKELLAFLRKEFLPNKVVAVSTPENSHKIPLTKGRLMKDGKTTVYVCEEGVCQFPTHDLSQVKKQVDEFKKYSLSH